MADYTQQMWAGLDPKRREAFERATTLDSTGAGAKLVQNLTNRIIQQLSLRHYGILGVMDTRPGQGQSALVNTRTEASAGAGNDWVADGTAPTSVVGAYARRTFDYKTLVSRGAISRKLQATGRSYIDIMAEEMMQKLEDFNSLLDAGLLLGDPASDWSSGDAHSTEGFLTACNTYGASATSTGTQVVNNMEGALTLTDGNTLTLSNLDKAIDLVKGSANRSDLVIVGSYGGLRALNKALGQRQVFNDSVEVAAGFRVRTYDGIPMIPDTNMLDTWSYVTAKGSDSKQTYLKTSTAGASTNLLVINKRFNWIEELTPTTVMPLAKTTSVDDTFDIFWDGAAVPANQLGSALVTGITPG
jgi:hypothetical protein